MELAYINIFVSDLDRAVAFYKDHLGLNLQFASPEHRYASFSTGSIRLGIALVAPEQKDLIGRHTGVGFTVVDLYAEYTRLSERGAKFEMPPTKQPWGGSMALIADPDGNIFYLDQAAS